MKIAVVGSGISGLVAAHLLYPEHDLTVFEASDRVGGHTRTMDLELDGMPYSVDTGFMVFNEPNYPNFSKLIRQLGVRTQPTDMGFSVRDEKTGLEYRSTSLNTLFSQRRNLLRPSFLRIWRDLAKFVRDSRSLLQNGQDGRTLAEYVADGGYSREFVDYLLVPMGAAIWSADPERMNEFPACYFVQFFDHHRFFSFDDRPQWRTIVGGSQRYIEAITKPFLHRIHLNAPVGRVQRFSDRVEVHAAGQSASFDEVILATHSDQALSLLADPTPAEREVLGAIPYQRNEAVLHTDTRVLPHARRAWASWNYLIPRRPQPRVAATYQMNLLQSLPGPHTFNVTLNPTADIQSELVLDRTLFQHPVYTLGAVASQKRHEELNGVRRTHYCGAYWGYGFHEDGVNSALRVCRHFGRSL